MGLEADVRRMARTHPFDLLPREALQLIAFSCTKTVLKSGQTLFVEGEPADVVAIAENYSKWLEKSATPKLFINADPGAILTGAQREYCRKWPNQREVTVKGVHFIQEDSPHEIGRAIAAWYQSI